MIAASLRCPWDKPCSARSYVSIDKSVLAVRFPNKLADRSLDGIHSLGGDVAIERINNIEKHLTSRHFISPLSFFPGFRCLCRGLDKP
jgi:hypothetical protein